MPPVYGGAGAQAALLGSTLAERGWDVSAITLDQSNVGNTTENGLRYFRLLRGLEPRSKWTRAFASAVLGLYAFAYVLVRRPAVVHIHGAFWWSIPPAIASRIIGAKTLVKLTRDGDDDPRTVYSKQIGPLRVGRIYGLSLTLADAIIALNDDARRAATSAGLAARTHLIPNGVDRAKLERTTPRRDEARSRAALSEEDRVVLFVGFLVKHKGVPDLLEAWRIIGNRDAHLWLVGPYEGFYRELDDETPSLVENLIQEGFNIKVYGHVPAATLPFLYWAADVFALPSYAEGMPNSLAESLVAGCHVVATRIPGIIQLLGESPDLLTPGDITGLAERIRTAMARSYPMTSAIADALSIENIASTYEALYANLLTPENHG